jgi:Raf kinase inhibitor-like YbhB/YbcL family protein
MYARNVLPVLLFSALTLPAIAAEPFTLTSSDLVAAKALSSAQVFSGMGCTGANLSPALAWKNAPANTRSYAITAYDPDAPTGSGWWHWVVFNVPAGTQAVVTGAGKADSKTLPAGAVQSRTDFGTPGYGGACPPPGSKSHRYQFTVFALDVDTLPLPPDSSAAMVGFNLNAHKLASAQIEATYAR